MVHVASTCAVICTHPLPLVCCFQSFFVVEGKSERMSVIVFIVVTPYHTGPYVARFSHVAEHFDYRPAFEFAVLFVHSLLPIVFGFRFARPHDNYLPLVIMAHTRNPKPKPM